MNKPLLASCCTAVLALLAACNNSTPTPTTASPAAKDTPAPAGGGGGGSAGKIKIGYLVKQPEEPWFQTEWRFAQKAADDGGFELLKIGTPDGEKVLAALDNLATSGAKGFVICTPDVRLGPAIKSKSDALGLKLMTVDDRFIGADGKPMEDVAYLGLAANAIGKKAGAALGEEAKRRGWTPADTAAVLITMDELATAKERTDGIHDGLVSTGFPADKIFTTPQRAADIPAALETTNSFLAKHPGVKHWLISGFNDNTVLGGVRALEGAGYNAETSCGVGINGTDCIGEFQKSAPTGFYGSMLLSARTHGTETTNLVYKWVKDGVQPPMNTRATAATLMTRENFKDALKSEGLENLLK